MDNDADNVSTDVESDYFTGGSADSAPGKIQTSQEVGVRLDRNKSWSSADLTAALAGEDPMAAIADKVAGYWDRRIQQAFVATMKGLFADNAAAPAGSEHVQGDLTNDISGSSYTAGVTDFSAEAFIDAAVTAGDSMEDLSMLMVHSIVYSRMQKNNLIDFIPDSQGNVVIPTFLGREVIVDDGLPVSSGVYESWIFGAGAVRFGQVDPKVPVETERKASSGNGGGSEVLYSRTALCIHPVGHKYAGSAPTGGPDNTDSTNMLAAAGSWERVYPERKQIKIARLITRES